MRVRNVQRRSEEIELQMTPMIDIVFQLLVFFIMTFKIVTAEGDFSIKMPQAYESGDPSDDQPLVVVVTITARADGGLGDVIWASESKPLGEDAPYRNDPFGELRYRIRQYVNDDGTGKSTAAETEVELDCDRTLHFQHVMSAITHIKGYIDDKTNERVNLVEKIRFKPHPVGSS